MSINKILHITKIAFSRYLINHNASIQIPWYWCKHAKRGLTSDKHIPHKAKRINNLGQKGLHNDGQKTFETYDYAE